MHKSSLGRCPAGPMWSKTEHPGGLGGAKRLTHFLLGETWAACTGCSRDLNHRVHFWLELEWRLLLLWRERRGSPGLFLVNVRLREREAQTAKEDPWQRLATALPECEFGFEHSLSLQSCSLSDEQVVVVSLERRFVNIKHLVPQVEGHAAARKKKKKLFIKPWKEQRASCLWFSKADTIRTCHQTTWQCARCSLVFHSRPHPSWLATELYFPPEGENTKK